MLDRTKAIIASPFLIILLILVCQVYNITLGHFWDEAWVYAPGIRSLGNDIPSILPDALHVDLSRGHPLLFQFLGGLWMKVFGLSNASAHSYALLITVLCTLAVYWLVEKSFGQKAAFFASALVAIQPIFVAQSAMLYPEMMMTLGLILALKGYIESKNWLFAIGLSIAIYSKETAIVFFVAFMAWDFLLLTSSRSGLKSFAKYLVPLLVMLSHPALLYLYHGWFLYPGHTGYITFNIQDIKWNARGVFAFLFEKQNRGWIVYPAIVLGVLSLRLRRIWFNLLLIGIGFSVYKVFVWKWVVPTWLYIVIMLIGIFSPLILWQWSNRGKTLNSIHHLIGIAYLLLIGFVIFSSMNFYTPRYMLSAIVLACTVSTVIVWNISWIPSFGKVILSVVGISLSGYSLMAERYAGELNLGLYDDLRVQQNMVDWMVENTHRSVSVCTNFVTSNYLSNHYSGYVDIDNFKFGSFTDICVDCQDAEFVIYTKTSGRCKTISPAELESSGYLMVFSDTIGASYATVYRRVD